MELAKNMKTHSSQFGLCNEQQRLQSNMTAVCPRLFEILTTLTLGALRKKIALCQQHLKTLQKQKNNETSSSSCGQQCSMKCQEHNRSKKGTLREKKRSDVYEGSTRKMISVIVDKLHRKEFMSITVLLNSKNSPASKYSDIHKDCACVFRDSGVRHHSGP